MKRVSFLCLTLLLVSGSVTMAEPPSDRGQQTSEFHPLRIVTIGEDSYLGVRLTEVTSDSVRRLSLKEERGALLTEVLADSPAAKAGLQKDDVIVRWNGERVDSAAELSRLKRETPAGRTVKLGVMRNGSEMETQVELGRYSDRRQSLVRWNDDGIRGIFVGERGRMGISLQNLTPQLAEYFGVPERTGALVSTVQPDSPAAKAGIKAGDVILSMGGEKIDTPNDIMRILSRTKEGPLEVRVMRNRQEMTFTVQVEKGGSSSNLLFDRLDSLIVHPPDVLLSMPELVMPRIDMPEITLPRLAPLAIPMPRIDMPEITLPRLAPLVVPMPRIEIPPIEMRLAPRNRILLQE